MNLLRLKPTNFLKPSIKDRLYIQSELWGQEFLILTLNLGSILRNHLMTAVGLQLSEVWEAVIDQMDTLPEEIDQP